MANISSNLGEFFENFINPISTMSPITEFRRIIRASKKLNELLFDNYKHL